MKTTWLFIALLRGKGIRAGYNTQITTQRITTFMFMASPLSLLRSRLFAAFFWVQFSGATNDNLFKFGVTLLLTYQLSTRLFDNAMAGVVIGGLFILPFLLFSATAGQVADKYPNYLVMQFVKNLEIAIMLLASIGFYGQFTWLLLLCVFLMGVHSTFFGPVKYAYLPQTLPRNQLMSANALVQTGTFLAILIGNFFAGLFLSIPSYGVALLASSCFLCALIGRLTAQFLPHSQGVQADLRINWNPISEIGKNLSLAYQQRSLFITMLLISWMWFFGAVFLNLFPILSKDILYGNESVASLILAVFAIGIGIGSLLCDRLQRLNWPLSLLGSIGMSLFSIMLYFTLPPTTTTSTEGLAPSTSAIQLTTSAELNSIMEFLAQSSPSNSFLILLVFLGLSICIGLFIVPLYTQLQQESAAHFMARIIAANNILNSIYLIVSSLIIGTLLRANFSVNTIFLGLGIFNALYCINLFQWLKRSKIIQSSSL